MNIVEELEKLQGLRERGVLSEEEFTLAKKRVIEGGRRESGTEPVAPATPSALQQFRRSRRDKWIGGVCGGLAAMSNIPSWSWRILFILSLMLHGIGLLAYLLLWIFVPLQSSVDPEPPVVDGIGRG
jgi:phage shock protein PspC (stress-responsive transcriptional regulator)